MNEIKYKPCIEYILRSTHSIFEPMWVGSGGITTKSFSAFENGKNSSLNIFTESLYLSRHLMMNHEKIPQFILFSF